MRYIISMPLVSYVLLSALRDRLLLGLIVILLVAASLSVFLGSAALIEKDKFSIVFAAGGIRIACILGVVLFVVSFIRRSFESRDIEFILSRPIGRVQLIMSYAVAFSLLSLIIGLAGSAVILSLGFHVVGAGISYWALSFILEGIVIANTAFFFAMYISSTALASMATFGFYILSRMMGQFLGIVHSDLVHSSGLASIAMQMVSMITPRLDLYAQTSWLLYGMDDMQAFYFAIAQGSFFCLLVLLAAMIDLIKRQF